MDGSEDLVYLEMMKAHDAAVLAGAEGYIDPATGRFVFTAAYLTARGECCGSGCRHCPFGDE